MELLAREGTDEDFKTYRKLKVQSRCGKLPSRKNLEDMLLDSITVTEAEAYDYYLKQISSGNNSIMEVNILEILTDSLSVY